VQAEYSHGGMFITGVSMSIVAFSKNLPPVAIPLTQGYSALVDVEDYERVSFFHWHAAPQRRKDGSIKNVYARHSSTKKHSSQLLHRFILELEKADKRLVDHINHNGLDCTRANLRVATISQNVANGRKQTTFCRKAPSSPFKGVTWRKSDKKWQAQIIVNGKYIHLGYFLNEVVAAKAYDAAARKHFGEFALLNFPEIVAVTTKGVAA
jgi:hypothetical protein